MANSSNGSGGLSWWRLTTHALRRSWRRLRRRWRRPNVAVVYHEAYRRSLEWVPLDSRRGELIMSFLEDEGLLDPGDVKVPRRPQMRALLRVHSAAYLESLQQPETAERIFGAPLSEAHLENVLEMQRMMVGGTVYATRLALQGGGVACNLGGGLHHANRDSGMGFCLFNDIAAAITRLRSHGFSAPVLVIDLDMHDGNGTRDIFARDPSVHTYSVHGAHWSATDAVASTAIELGDGVSDELFLGTVLKTLPDVVESVRPGIVYYLAGTDGAADDALGSWELTAEGLLGRDRFVIEMLRRRDRPIPVVVALAGGYGVGAWRYSARFLSWLISGRVIEPPAEEEILLRRLRRIGRSLDRAALTTESDPFAFRLTEEDLVGIMPQAPRQTRFLGYFSRQGVELLLERFGIFDRLRVLGYEQPALQVDIGHPLGQTLRVFSGTEQHDLLMELRVDRNPRCVEGCEMLVVEWLLLQNPRAHFGPYRRPLPGQTHPGLGMLKDVLGWLVVVCEMLELDGIYYAPSSFHVAAQSRRMVRFLHAEHEARYRALAEAVQAMDLATASRTVDEGGVVDADTGEPAQVQGFPMVLPVSEALRQRVFGEEYEARVEAELERLHYRLREPAAGASGETSSNVEVRSQQ
jgi:acetoin utilization deacetylase AcuC-like enzyme